MIQQALEHDIDPEKTAALRKIRRLMAFWHIDPSELGDRVPRTRPKLAPVKRHYRHPVTGDTWDGIGAQPDWIKTALIKEGYTVDELRATAPQPKSS